jgi:DNA polymerase III sliding clamp (beta) subunit (PCNA family)
MDINSSDLELALKVVRTTVGSSSDISSHYVFRNVGDKLEVLSYDGSTFSSCIVPNTTVDSSVKFTVEARRLHALLSTVGSNQVLNILVGDDGVAFRTSRGKPIPFYSLDPSLFPFWDEVLSKAKSTVKVSADRLHAAFAHAKQFIFDQESKAAHLCVAEFRGGVLYSTDNTGVSLVKMPGMEGSSLRVYVNDIGNVLSFLATAKGTDVELLESDRASFIRRADGAVFGETVFGHRFPDYAVDWELVDDQSWSIFQEELLGALKLLQSAAKTDDSRVRFQRVGDEVVLSMTDASGKLMSQTIPMVEFTQHEKGIKDMPVFGIADAYIIKLLNGNNNTKVTLGVTKREKGGWLRVRDVRGTDTYLTTLAWLKLA